MAKWRFPRRLQRRFIGFVLLPLGPITHWPPQPQGPSADQVRRARQRRAEEEALHAGQRRAAIEWFSTFMLPVEAAHHYDANERGEAT